MPAESCVPLQETTRLRITGDNDQPAIAAAWGWRGPHGLFSDRYHHHCGRRRQEERPELKPRRSATMRPRGGSGDRCDHITGGIMLRRSVILSAITSALTGAVAAGRARAQEVGPVDLTTH